jgi:hypothetical protein
LSKLLTAFREGRVPMERRPSFPKNPPTVYPKKLKDSSGSRAIRVLVVFTSKPNLVISRFIRTIAAPALPGRQQITKSSA